MTSLNQAHTCINKLESLPPVAVSLHKAFGLVCATDVFAVHNCPTVDASLKDGFAGVSSDMADHRDEPGHGEPRRSHDGGKPGKGKF